MIGQLYIDDIDTYSQFGVWISEGGYDGLLPFPDLQDPDKNVWPEEDGIEVDLEYPTLKAKDRTISFVASNPNIDASEFVAFLSTPGYRVFTIPALKRSWKLRLSKQSSNEVYTGVSSFSLIFSDDLPVRSTGYPVPAGSGVYVPVSAYKIDTISLEKYGIMVLEGRDSLLMSSAVRENLTRSFKGSDGRLYDTGKVNFKEKEVTFKCLLSAESIDRFWDLYDAFFNNLIKPRERLLYYDGTGRNYKCYYKKTSGWKIIEFGNRMTVEFSFTLIFTSFRVGGTVYLMATEDGALVTTEDDHGIDLSVIRPPVQPAFMAQPAPAPVASEPADDNTAFRRRKITEMPETSSLEGLYVPAVDSSNRNVRVAASKLGGSGGTGNIVLLAYDKYVALTDKRSDTLYACLDAKLGRITRAYVGVYPLLCSGMDHGGEVDDRFTYTFPFRLGGSGTDNKFFDYIIPFVLQ